jgi:hypothetical protein
LLGNLFYLYGVAVVGAARAAAFLYLSPLFSAALSILARRTAGLVPSRQLCGDLCGVADFGKIRPGAVASGAGVIA